MDEERLLKLLQEDSTRSTPKLDSSEAAHRARQYVIFFLHDSVIIVAESKIIGNFETTRLPNFVALFADQSVHIEQPCAKIYSKEAESEGRYRNGTRMSENRNA